MRPTLMLCFLLGIGVASAQESAVPGPAIGYPDVGAALRDLRANQQAAELQQANGWTWYFVQEGDEGMAIWTFVPFNDPAYPSAIKRVLLMRDGALVMETRTMCQADPTSCDAFFAATTTAGKQFAEYFANEIIANAARLEQERKEQRRYQEHVRDYARSMYGRP